MKVKDLKIHFLADVPEFLPLLAEWTFAEWGHFDPSNTLEKTRARFEERMNKSCIPLTLVALVGEEAVGCVSLKEHAMSIHPELSPWLGSMYVQPLFRRQGIGSALVRRVLAEAKRCGARELFLWTEKAEDFYKKFGFETIEKVYYLSQHAKVMRVNSAFLSGEK